MISVKLFRIFLILSVFSISAFAQDMTLDELVSKNIEARGGEAAWQKVNTMKITGNYRAFSLDNPFTIYRKKPNLFRFEHVMIAKDVVFVNGKDSTWVQSEIFGAEKPTRITNLDSATVQRDAIFEPILLHAKNSNLKMTFLGMDDCDMGDCYGVEILFPDSTNEKWYFDAETFLETKHSGNTTDFGRRLRLEMFYDDFRDINGVKIPFKLEQEFGTRYRVFEVDAVEVNLEIKNSLF